MKLEGFEASNDQRGLKIVTAQAGAFAGFVMALIVILFKKQSGFLNLPPSHFFDLWPLIILNGTAAGAFSAFICGQLAVALSHSLRTSKRRLIQSLLVFSGFVISVLVQQLSARNALAPPVWNAALNRFYGGPLGEPNFETLATGIIGGVYFLSLTTILSQKLPQGRDSLFLYGMKATIPGVLAWCVVYSFYVLLVSSQLVPKHYIPWKLAAIFIVDFPHPERVVLYIVFCFVFTMAVLAYVQRNYRTAGQNGSIQNQAFLDQVMVSIDRNLANPDFGPQQLASELGLSQGHLNRKLNNIAGVTTTGFILKTRLKKAALLLQDDFDSISRIAFHVGFNNLSYFNRSFKKEFNLTPSQYRKNHSTF